MDRASISGAIPDGTPKGTADALHALPPLKSIALVLDQLVNRADEETRRYAKPEPFTKGAHADDLKRAEESVKLLELGAKVGRAMLENIRAQGRGEHPAELSEPPVLPSPPVTPPLPPPAPGVPDSLATHPPGVTFGPSVTNVRIVPDDKPPTPAQPNPPPKAPKK